jgi:outer membrane protein TolC
MMSSKLFSSFVALFVCASLLFSSPAFARRHGAEKRIRAVAPPSMQTLNLRDAVAYALTHSPTLLAKQADVIGLIVTFTKQRASQYPSIVAQLENQMQTSQNTAGNLAQFGISPESRFSLNTARIVSQWTLYNGSLNQILSQQDRRRVESASAELQRSEEQLIGDTAAAFYELIAHRETTTLAAHNERYQRKLLDFAHAAEHAGRTAGVDVMRARVQVLRARAALLSARVEERNARETLALRIGAPPNTAFLLPARIPQPPEPKQSLAELTTKALTQRPDQAAARADLAYAQLAESAIDTDLKPSVVLSGSFGSQVSPTGFTYQQQQIDAQNAAALAQYELQRQLAPTANIAPPIPLPPVNRHVNGFWQLGLEQRFSVPVLDYGQRATAHHAARAQILAASAALTNTRYAIELDVRQAARNLAFDQENIELAQRGDTLATRSARIAQLQFQHGLISFTDVTQTQETALSAHADLVKARTTYAAAFVRLRVAVGYAGIDAVGS